MQLGGIQDGDFESFKRPGRKPWLLLVIVAVAALIVLRKQLPRRAPRPVPVEPEVVIVDEGRGPAAVEAPRAGRVRELRPTPPALDAQGLFRRAEDLTERDELVRARLLYLAILKQGPDERMRLRAEDRLGKIDIALIFSPRPMPEKEEYIVRKGDSVRALAHRYGTTSQLIGRGNNLKNANVIKVGDRLRIFTGTFSLKVSRARNDMVVSMNGEFFKRYRVGTGKYERTPTGTFQVVEKQEEPTWWPQGREIPFGHPENILGTRWMSIRATGDTPDARGYGIHGTWDDSSIGKSESAGCIRMKNEDVEELFIYVPAGAEVVIGD